MVASELDPEAPMQRLVTVGILGLLHGLQLELGLLAIRAEFVKCLVGFDIAGMLGRK